MLPAHPHDLIDRDRHYFNYEKVPRVWRACPRCGDVGWLPERNVHCNRQCRPMTLEQHNSWKGADAKYSAFHMRVRRAFGAAKEHECAAVFCDKRAQHWANITGNYNDVGDYLPLCASCHKVFDNGGNLGTEVPEWRFAPLPVLIGTC